MDRPSQPVAPVEPRSPEVECSRALARGGLRKPLASPWTDLCGTATAAQIDPAEGTRTRTPAPGSGRALAFSGRGGCIQLPAEARNLGGRESGSLRKRTGESGTASGGIVERRRRAADDGSETCATLDSHDRLRSVAPSATLISMATPSRGSRVLKTAWFAKAARKAGISDDELCRAVRQTQGGTGY